jgi:SAM-dependent methyltransferase
VMTDGYYFDPRVAESYDADVDRLGDEVRESIAFYVGLARQAADAGQTVLELGCGTGRVTIPIAQAGAEVTGLDNAPAMLDVARRKATDAGNPRWVLDDMASFQLEQRFGLVIIPFRSFLLLLTTEAQRACLTRIREHLLEGGRLALDVFNPSILAIAGWLGNQGERWQRSTLAKDRELWFSRRYLQGAQELDETRAEVRLNDAGAVIQRVERNLRLRWVWRYEMEHLLALCGFEVEALYGSFDGRPFGEDSHEMIWVARRANRPQTNT